MLQKECKLNNDSPNKPPKSSNYSALFVEVIMELLLIKKIKSGSVTLFTTYLKVIRDSTNFAEARKTSFPIVETQSLVPGASDEPVLFVKPSFLPLSRASTCV